MMVVIHNLKHNIINLNNMKGECTNQTNQPETYLIVNKKSGRVIEISPVAYNKTGELTIGVDSNGCMYIHDDLNQLVQGVRFSLAISTNKITKGELEKLVLHLSSL